MKRTVERKWSREQGLTLLELLIVISILGLLAVLASVQLSGYFKRAKHDTAKLQIEELATALELYQLDVGRFPSDQEGLEALLKDPANTAGWRGPYLKKEQAIIDPWGREFRYSQRNESPGYAIGSYGADGQPGGDGENADIGS
jgi:general secretion pathway protein G